METVAGSKRATLAELLPDLSRDRLKELCRALGLEDGGREKSVIVERLVGRSSTTVLSDEPPRLDRSTPPSNPSPSSRPPPSPRRPRASEAKNGGGDLGFERTLFLAADKLRNNMDAAEYKHVVLGLIFLKYISDAFEELHAKLDGADR